MCSVSVGSTIPGRPTKTFVRKDSSPEALLILMENFVQEIRELAEEAECNIPQFLIDAEEKLYVEIAIKNSEKFCKDLCNLKKLHGKLNAYFKFNIFGFNSGMININNHIIIR